MYEEIIDSIYDTVSNNSVPDKVENQIEEYWEDFEKEPSPYNALALCSMYELKGFYLGFEAAMSIVLRK